MGQKDRSVGYASLVQIRDAAIANYQLTGPTTISSDSTYHHDRWSGSAQDGPFGSGQGHCIAGSTSDPYAAQYAIPCKLPNSFVWGEQVIGFFLAHPMT